MSDPISAAISGMFSLASGGLAMTGSAIENRKQRKFAAAEAQKARDWAEEMSNTAHQREVDDLRAAGLNPILSATGGNGATTPTAASASAPATRNSALDGLQAAASIYNALSAGQLNAASAKKAEADAEKAEAESKKIREQTKVEKSKGDFAERSQTWLERGWDFFSEMKSPDDVRHTFNMASNAGDVERHRRSLEDKKAFKEALDRDNKRALEAPIIDVPYGDDVEGDDVHRGVPSDWKYWTQTDSKRVLLRRDENGEAWKETYFDVFRKPDGDFVRVRRNRRSYVFNLRRKK